MTVHDSSISNSNFATMMNFKIDYVNSTDAQLNFRIGKNTNALSFYMKTLIIADGAQFGI